MSSTPWFPVACPGQTTPASSPALSNADFRVEFKIAFQRELMRVFFADARVLTGAGSLKELLGRLGVDVSNEVELRVWYERARGERFPRADLVDKLRIHLPNLRLDLHHPMLRWLCTRTLDERSIRRLKARMPAMPTAAIRSVQGMAAHELEMSPALCDLLSLHEMGYLDALFVFACARNRPGLDAAKEKQINRILWSLPILYPDDVLWIGSCEENRWLLERIDLALGLAGAADPSSEWDGHRREQVIFSQMWHAEQRLKNHARALSRPLTRRRFWARIWRWREAVA
jgi:hypothetical protein